MDKSLKPDSPFAGFVYVRLDSRRLPGKALKKLGGIPLLEWAVRRTARGGFHPIILTTDRPVDDPLEAFGEKLAVPVFRGDLDNVAKRTYDCLQTYPEIRCFARINGDSPFLDWQLLERAKQAIEAGYEFVTNLVPRRYPYGISAEVITRRLFERMYPCYDSPKRQEHITQLFYDKLHEINTYYLADYPGDDHHIRMVVDHEEDLFRLNELLAGMKGTDAVEQTTPQFISTFKSTFE